MERVVSEYLQLRHLPRALQWGISRWVCELPDSGNVELYLAESLGIWYDSKIPGADGSSPQSAL